MIKKIQHAKANGVYYAKALLVVALFINLGKAVYKYEIDRNN